MVKKPAGSFYRHVLRDAWRVTIKNPALWILGFFVSFMGNGGIYELLIQGTNRLGLQEGFGGLTSLLSLVPSGAEFYQLFRNIGVYNTAVVMLLIVGGLGLLAVAIWVVVSSQGALLTGIKEASKGKKPMFSALFGAGGEVFAPLLVLNVISRIAITVCFYLLMATMVFLLAKATILSALGYLLAFLILTPLTLIIGFVTIFAAGYVTLYRMSLIESIETAVVLFRTYWLISLETLVVLFAINLIFAFGLAVLLMIVASVFLLVIGFGFNLTGIDPWPLLPFAVTIGVAFIVMAGAGLAAFQYSTWTLLFMKLNQRGHGAVSKIVRVFNKYIGA
jgi:hypothetical protein